MRNESWSKRIPNARIGRFVFLKGKRLVAAGQRGCVKTHRLIHPKLKLGAGEHFETRTVLNGFAICMRLAAGCRSQETVEMVAGANGVLIPGLKRGVNETIDFRHSLNVTGILRTTFQINLDVELA